MDQIYNFEGVRPPVLNENMLRAERERRKAQLLVVLFIVAAAIVMLCIVTFTNMVAEFTPVAALVCIGYVVISVLVSGTAAIMYAQKGGASV